MRIPRRILVRTSLALATAALLAWPVWAAIGPGLRPTAIPGGGGQSQGGGFRLFGTLGQPLVGRSTEGSTQREIQSGRIFVRPWATAVEDPYTLPARHRLLGSYPNPFNPRTTVRYELARSTRVRITVHDTRGRLVTTLVDETANAGSHAVSWSGLDHRGRSVPSGTYYLRLDADGQVQSHKMTLLK